MGKVFVGNLSSRTRELELANEFRAYGLVKSVWIARNPPGYAFVEFDSRQEACDAVAALDGKNGWRVELSRSSSGAIRSRSLGRDTRCRECGSHRHRSRDCRFRASQSSRSTSTPHFRGHMSRDSPKRSRSRSRSRRCDDQLTESSDRAKAGSPSQQIDCCKSPLNVPINVQVDRYPSPQEREHSSSPPNGYRSSEIQKGFQSDGPAVSEAELSGSSEHLNYCGNSLSPSN